MAKNREIVINRYEENQKAKGIVVFKLRLHEKYRDRFRNIAEQKEIELREDLNVDLRTVEALANRLTLEEMMDHDWQKFTQLKNIIEEKSIALAKSLPYYIKESPDQDTNIPEPIKQLPDDPFELKRRLALSEKARIDAHNEIQQLKEKCKNLKNKLKNIERVYQQQIEINDAQENTIKNLTAILNDYDLPYDLI